MAIPLFTLSCLLFMSFSAVAAPDAKLWSYWNTADDTSTVQIDHQPWQDILDIYLVSNLADGINRFQYDRVIAADKQRLEGYLQTLAAVDPRSLNKNEQLAYWINLYNALTVDIVLKKYPVKSIRNIRYLSSLFGPWDKSLIKIAGQNISLNDIEHRILRPIWRDPRIHFVVNCASLGCPNLTPRAFIANNLDQMFESCTREFINHPRGLRRDGPSLIISSIFKWYSKDFGDSEAQVIEYLARYLAPNRLDLLTNYQSVEFEYDWNLNEAAQ